MITDTPKQCPQCLTSGKGQFPLVRIEVWGNDPNYVMSIEGTAAKSAIYGFSSNGEPFHEVRYKCGNCGSIFFDTE